MTTDHEFLVEQLRKERARNSELEALLGESRMHIEHLERGLASVANFMTEWSDGIKAASPLARLLAALGTDKRPVHPEE